MIFFCIKGCESEPDCWYPTLDGAMHDNPANDEFVQIYASVTCGQEFRRVQ